MRFFAVIVLALSTACATTSETARPRPINVAAVKNQIAASLEGTTPDRQITSMGRVTAERAVVYTTTASGDRQEETWVKSGGAWKLEAATPIAGTDAAGR